MERIVKPAGRLVAAAVTVVVATIAIYLFAVLQIYILGWVIGLIQKIF